MSNNVTKLAKKLLGILDNDEDRLQRIDDYLHGIQDDPYMPLNADDEYRMLAKRAVSNWMPLLVGTPAQALYVDGFRRGVDADGTETNHPVSGDSPEWKWWQLSRMDARQAAIYRGALAYGHSFVLTELRLGKVSIKGLSPLRTAAIYEDPANDETPYAALTIDRHPEDEREGRARMWDGTYEYPVRLTPDGPVVGQGKRHGASSCPVTRFAAGVDLDGRTVGVIEPMIPLQNRINQTVMDLLVAQSFQSHQVRYATGMAPPLERDPETGEPIVDEHGNPKPLPMDYNARRFLFAEDSETRFGSLEGTPLDGFINSIDMSIRHLAAVSQTPPHHLLGQIANLSAEALLAAETSLSRKIEEFRKGFGEGWERVFRLAAELTGDDRNAENFSGEIVWRDMEQRSLAQSADALGKLAEQLQVPRKGLWRRIPGVTQTEIDDWTNLYEEEDAERRLAEAVTRATQPSTRSRASAVPAA